MKSMDLKRVYLFITVALTLTVRAEYDWSGFVNNIKDNFDYVCNNSLAITGIASIFNDGQNDRQWEYQCASGGSVANVSSSCTLQESINDFTTGVDFECPSGGYIAGFLSTFSDADDDRVWQPYCCSRPYSSLIDCDIPTSLWENNVENLLNWTTTDGRILTGLQSFYSAFNRDRRWRFKQCKLEVSCGDPGIPSNAARNGDSFLYLDEVVFTCNHGYHQSSGPEGGRRVCQDTGLWSDTQPVCSLCTDIENCADIRCTNPTDQYCAECDSDQGYGLGERGYINLNTSCNPLCSWLQSFCYPGECPGDYLSCNCSEGFAGLDCLTITDEPDLNSCDVTITSPGTVPSKCSINATEHIYIDFVPSQLSVDFDTSFVFNDAPPKPAYVQSYQIGVSTVDVTTAVYRMNSYPDSAATSTSNPCSTVKPSPDIPLMLVDCSNIESNFSVHTFLHGDWFEVGVSVSNGGYLNITDLDSNDTATHYYTGSKIFPYSLFVIDLQPPTHCSIEKSLTCLTDQVVLDEALVFNNRLQLSWGGWSDTPSQVQSYEIAIFKLIYDSDSEMLDTDISPVYTMTFDSEETKLLYTDSSDALPDEGPYSVILTIFDTAGNRQYARRIIVYDDDSDLIEDNTVPLVISSGVEESEINAYWHNSTIDPIVVSGQGHFYNQNLKTDNWLAPVSPHTPAVPAVFDDEDRFGVNNSLGITTLHYQYIVDQEAGQSAAAQTQPASFLYETDDLALEAVEVTPLEINDGDSVTIWFEARDFKNNHPLYESVLVHIDSSPPQIENLGLIKEGIDHLIFLYGSEALVNLDISFESMDIHSGIDSIHWTLKTDLNMIGEGDMPVFDFDKDDCLLESNCICDIVDHCHSTKHSINILSSDFYHDEFSTAIHDTDYYLTISVTNHAQLVASLTEKFTVDLTKPLSGKVYERDSSKKIHDIDYQTDKTFTVQWGEFFDRESAIITYQYIVDTQCSPASAFEYPNLGSSKAISTSNTSIQWTVSDLGVTYYTTVVAYNGAYLASDPVCSDGVTIDTQSPLFTGVHIPEAKVHEGVVTSEGDVWVIHRNRERSKVDSPGLACINNSLEMSVEEISAFSIRYTTSSNVSLIPSDECLSFPKFDRHTYTPIYTVFNISWSASDNVGIRDYQFGVSSARNYSLTTPDLIPYTSTAGFDHFSAYHNLFGSWNEFYISIKAIDLAMHETIVVTGPVVVDISPPVFNGTVVTKQIDELMIVTWDEWTVMDDEDVFSLTYQYSIGRTKFSDSVQPFTPVPSSQIHLDCLSSLCIILNTTQLGFLKGNSYHVTVSVENSAGLFLYIPVDPITMPFILDSSCLSVFEYPVDVDIVEDSKSYFSEQYDHDIILEGDNITISWYSLTDDHYNASFYVAIGSKPGQSDVLPFIAVGDQNHFELPVFTFELNHIYYSTVMAENADSVVYQSSDGFRIISDTSDDAGIWNGLSEYHNQFHQLSTTEVSAQWYYPSSISQYASHYEWALYESNNLSYPILDYQNMGTSHWGIRSADLKSHTAYVTAVRACFKSFCLDSVYSDEFWVALTPDSTDFSINKALYTPNTIDEYGYSSSGQLYTTWSYSSKENDIVKYEWAIGTSATNGEELLMQWTSTDHSTVSMTYTGLINLHKHHYVTVRGINAAGLVVSQTAKLVFAGDYTINDVIVFDVTPDYVPDETEPIEFILTEYNDLDYTSIKSSLSAVWPNLRYTIYNYSISTTKEFQSCTSDSALSCGATQYNGITVDNLNLTHGVTYYFCVLAEAENIFTPYPSGPATIRACSNGIMAYLTPPTGACVQIKSLYDEDNTPTLTPYELLESNEDNEVVDNPHSCAYSPGSQTSTSSIHIIWNQFTDTVMNEDFPHKSRIAFYEYAIGSTPGAENVVQFTKVGAVTSVYVTGLQLQHGITYYATIRATDLAGSQSVSTSFGLSVDLTPPTFSNIWINTESAISVNSLEELTLQWGRITDRQSGISRLYWSLGSEQGLSDIYKWTQVNVTALEAVASDPAFHVPDGQPIILNLMVINNAGLSSIGSSSMIVYDSTKPCSGRVFDGPKQYDSKYVDLDYTSDHSSISAHWEPFTDPHTSITEYKLAVGSCIGCSDVSPYISTGLLTDIQRKMSLKQGHTYYVTVQGCSEYSGCATSYSDSFTVDITGPVIRRLRNGLPQSVFQNFQASRNTISGHWSDIHDSESSITHYVYYIGTSPGDDNIVTKTTVPPSSSHVYESTPFDGGMDELPINELIYITLEVYNGVGVVNTITSSGVVVSDQSPVANEVPFIDYDWSGSIVNDTQYARSALRVRWNFTDTNLIVDKYFWRVMFEDSTYQSVPPQISYKGTHQTLLQLDLSDGSTMSAVLIACNQAGICVQTETLSNVSVDSTPPVDGYFAVKTDSAAVLPWAIDDGMILINSNDSSSLNLTFTGFTDSESSIAEYWATVGSVYMNSDLYNNSNESLSSVSQQSDSDVLSSHITLTRNISSGEKLYVSLWAINGVGVRSRVVQGTFEAVVSWNSSIGYLKLLRTQLCPVESCVGHCTCGERGNTCDLSSSCTERSWEELADSEKVNVTNLVSQASAGGSDPLFTAVSDKLVATVEFPSPSSYQFAEWSVGEKGKDVGSGVMDISSDPVWFPLVSQQLLIFDVSETHPLILGKTYVFYVRVWYNSSHYAVFESNGVTFDNMSPLVNRGYRVKEVEVLSSNIDIDYIGSTSELLVKWLNIYSKRYATVYAKYELCIGLSPGSDDVIACTEMKDTNHSSLSGLSLNDNTEYYTVLKVTTSLGVVSTAISDGFTVDLSPPDIGAVFDGKYFNDEYGHTLSSSSYVRVFGFNDPQSGIKSFQTKASFSNGEEESSYTDNEIARIIKLEHMELEQGNTSYVSVIASNAAGISSTPVTSSGSVYDSTPPMIHECVSALVDEPTSFDTNGDSCACFNGDWSFLGEYKVHYITEMWSQYSTIPVDNCCALELMWGSGLSRAFGTTTGTKYTLSFWVLVDGNTPTEVLVECNGVTGTELSKKTILRPTCDNRGKLRWQKLEYVFNALSDTTTISITAPPYLLLVIDNIELKYCESIVSLDQTTFAIGHHTRPDTISWPVYDTQSGIQEYMYAIGTVQGGIQINDYQSVGATNWGFHDLWNTVHDSKIHFSVKATNKAGLSAVYYSDSIIIDKTAPTVSANEGVREVLTIGGSDLDYTSSEYTILDWTGVADEESGIMHCVWALGSSPGLIDVKNYTVSQNSFYNLTFSSESAISPGSTIYTSVVCLNEAGLAVSTVSDGIMFLTSPPRHEVATITIYNPTLTECSAMEGYASADSIQVVWDGFIEESHAPLYYQMKIVENGQSSDSVQWKDMNSLKQVTVSNLTLLEKDVEHMVMVRAYSVDGLYSEAVSESFILVSAEPTIDDTITLNVTQQTGLLYVQWKNLFTTVGPLYYEVSIGDQLGGGAIRKFVTTENDFIQVDENEIKASSTYFISVKAVNYAGLSAHANYMINGEMAFKL